MSMSMKSSFFRYTIYAVNIILYITSCVTWIVIPEFWKFNLGLTLFCILLTAWIMYIHRQPLSKYANSPHFKALFANFCGAILVFLIFAIINFWGYHFPRQIDLTRQKKNSLSSQSSAV
ncbi:MAG: hypothetical protein HQK53_03710, partial [Oligoflexia bacterium]|nr:hypothetical protein [Oligoflexia bacterium]